MVTEPNAIREDTDGASRGSPYFAIERWFRIPHDAPGVIMLSSTIVQRTAGLRCCRFSRRRRDVADPESSSPESVYSPVLDGARLRGSPSLVGRGVANPVRSALGGSNPPPRAVVRK